MEPAAKILRAMSDCYALIGGIKEAGNLLR